MVVKMLKCLSGASPMLFCAGVVTDRVIECWSYDNDEVR